MDALFPGGPRRLIRYAAAAATLYWLYRLYQDFTEGDDRATETEPTQPASNAAHAHEPSDKRRRPSFSLTDENGNKTGALSDASAQGWGWIVDSKKPAAKQTALKSNPEARVGRGVEQSARESKGVKFRLDARSNFYGFVYRYVRGAHPNARMLRPCLSPDLLC